jgi:hypothetical protein
MLNKVTGLKGAVQLLLDNAIPASFAGAGGSWHAEDRSVIRQTCQTAGLHSGSTNFVVGELTEQLTKALDMLIKQRRQRLRGAVAAGKAGTASGDNNFYFRISDPSGDHGAHLVDIIDN